VWQTTLSGPTEPLLLPVRIAPCFLPQDSVNCVNLQSPSGCWARRKEARPLPDCDEGEGAILVLL
jgi:hypothetical protein